MRRVRLGLFLAAFAAWALTVVFALLIPACRDPLGEHCPSSWESDAATAALGVALALTVLATAVGAGHWLLSVWRAWRDRGALP